ncbi:recombinase family protein [Taklimakanibacter deserti]|uniref:recombinase family protein n=1 Tax=Taklimakanibacter deserti TaxID=2267839 RepID=UPI000E64639B
MLECSEERGELRFPSVNPSKRAAMYVRMSTEHQKYSTENQGDAIRRYATARNIEIVRVYADQGKSGLRLDGRDALKRLIDEVQNGQPDFEVILAYDVSRWGRFQDADESAYYEYICRRVGIEVHYCAEQFENDGSPISTIVKGVKRAMAGEYSRELSAKVFAGQCRLIELGYRQGGPAGYGLRRALVDQSGVLKGILDRGAHKSIQTDRVVLRPGPDDELQLVRGIYRAFVSDRHSEQEIADDLNARGLMTDLGRRWTKGTIHQILINEKYIGNNVWNRISFKLKKLRVHNDPSMWVRANGAFPAVIDRQMFEAAQTIIAARSFRLSDSEMLTVLQQLFARQGLLSAIIIDEAEGLPSSSAYRSRFGSLLRAYSLVGYRPRRDYRYIAINQVLRRLHPDIMRSVLDGLEGAGALVDQVPLTDLVSVNGEFTLSVVIARCRRTQADALRWKLRLDVGHLPDITVAVRMDAANRSPFDYYLLPRFDFVSSKLNFAEENHLQLDAYRVDTLDTLFDLARPVSLKEVA